MLAVSTLSQGELDAANSKLNQRQLHKLGLRLIKMYGLDIGKVISPTNRASRASSLPPPVS